jgi:hypothetical protein
MVKLQQNGLTDSIVEFTDGSIVQCTFNWNRFQLAWKS